MTEKAHIGEWIEHLSDANPRARNDSLRSLHNEGVSLCAESLDKWTTDPEFAGLLRRVHSSGGQPRSRAESIVVGIAVMPEIFQRIRSANGNAPLSSVPPNQDALEFELFLEAGVNLDVLTSRDPEGSGAIARFLRKFGGGIQQVELYIRDVDRGTEILRSRFGLAPIYPATQSGAEGTRVNFFLISISDGKKLLIELVEGRR